MIKAVGTLLGNIWNFLTGLWPGYDPSRLQTEPALLTLMAAGALCFCFFLIRTWKLSAAIRKMKEGAWGHQPNKADLKQLKHKSRTGTLVRILVTAVLAFALVYFVYPRIPQLAGSGSATQTYETILEEVKRRKLLLLAGTFGSMLLFPVWLIAFSRRSYSKGPRVLAGVYAGITICSLLITIPMLLTNQNREKGVRNAAFRVSADEMVNEANSNYQAGDYERAMIIYEALAEEQADETKQTTDYTRADVLNNLALAQMQTDQNEKALATMEEVFRTDSAGSYHVINLLVAAQLNGIASGEILRQNRRAAELMDESEVIQGGLKDYVRLRNALAYNVAYMDMELDDRIADEGTDISSLFPESTGTQSWHTTETQGAGTSYQFLEQALADMQEENQEAYGGEDADIKELSEYLEARMAGGTPSEES